MRFTSSTDPVRNPLPLWFRVWLVIMRLLWWGFWIALAVTLVRWL